MSFGFAHKVPKFDRPMWVLLGSFLIQHTGYYLALPFLAAVFNGQFGLTAGQAGLVLGAISLAYQISGVVGGPMSDRFGRRLTMVVGLVLQTGGFLLYAGVRTLPLLLAAGGLIGVGGGLFAPAARAGIAALATHEAERTTAFSIRGIAANIGMSIGPLLGALLIGNPYLFFGAAAAFHAVLAIGLPFFLPAGCEGGACARGVGGAILRALKSLPFVLFSLAVVFVWALDAQMTTALPLRVSELTGSMTAIGLLATFNSILIIFLQIPISTRLLRRLHPLTSLSAGVILMGAGLASIAWGSKFWHLAASVSVLALGQMFYVPTIDITVAIFAKGESIGSFFGIATLVWGLGTALGNLGGGQAVAVARSTDTPALPWYLFAAVGVITGIGILVLRRWTPMRRILRTQERGANNPSAAPAWRPEELSVSEHDKVR